MTKKKHKKFTKNLKILYILFKKQFFLKNKLIFIFLPLIISIALVYFKLYDSLFDKDKISLMVTIISLIGGILLNLLILILSNKNSILYKNGTRENYGTFKLGYKPNGEEKIINVSYFQFFYNKIFFIIILSVIYLFFYIFHTFGLFYFLLDFDFIKNNIDYIIHLPYIFFIIFYMINFLYLLLKLSFLLQNED